MTATPKWDTIAIVGVGLIGGSIGLALRQRGLCRQVVGIGRRAVSLRAARRRAAISSATTDIARGVAGADLVVICTPVEHVIDHARQVLTHCRPDALVTDAASTKARIVTEIEALHASSRPALRGRFVGSHPMAGSEKSGVRFAEGDLFVSPASSLPLTRS